MVAVALSLLIFPRANPGLPQTETPAGKLRIELFWSDYKLLKSKLSAGARQALEREAQTIFAEAGIELSFFVGAPEESWKDRLPLHSHRSRAPLGRRLVSTEQRDGRDPGRNARAGTVFIFVPVVERTIGLEVDGKVLHDGRKAHALARALARVLAHETVHVIDPEIPHGPEGSIMSANLTRALLLDHRLSFHEATSTQLLQSLAQTAGGQQGSERRNPSPLP